LGFFLGWRSTGRHSQRHLFVDQLINSTVKSGHSITRHVHCDQAPHIAVLRES
jgi:hypothetical protein